MSSPSLDSLPPQAGHAQGAGMTSRSRGRCAGSGARTGLLRVKLGTALIADAATSSSVARAFSSSSCSSSWSSRWRPAFGGLPEPVALHLGDQQLQMRHHRLGAGRPRLGLLPRRALGNQRSLQCVDVVGNRFGYCHEPDCRMRRNLKRNPSLQAESNRRSLSPPPPDASSAPGCASQFPQACKPAELK